MRTLAFDGRMGASGDMLLAALLAVGADRDALAPVEDALGVRYEVGRTAKNGIAATTVDVLLTGDREDCKSLDHEHGDGQEDNNHDGHDHDGHDHDEHRHGQDDHEKNAEGSGPLRTYPEVLEIVESIGIPADVEADATSVFELLGEAEAAVHDTNLEATHFHEVGADDAIADVVGVCLLVANLDVERVVTTPQAAGGGEIEMNHGIYPVPPPAVINLAERASWTLRGGPVEAELLTPTAAALLAHFAEGVEALPEMRVKASGYGAGGYDFPDHPNVLRVLVGESRGGLARDEIVVLETNVDDVSPEFLGGLQEHLAEAGARDVTVLPTTMKKSRPGHLVKVIAKPEDARRVARRLAAETGTLGVREAGGSHRWIARRRMETATLLVEGERHPVAVKVAGDEEDNVFDVSAEYDDAAAVAAETGLPTRVVARRAEEAVRTGGALDDVLVHVLEADDWAAVEGDYYEPPSLDDAGFVHLSPVERAPGVAQYNFSDAADPLLLVIDRGVVEPEIRYEEVPSGTFPHAYGPLNVDAIADVLRFLREEGRYVLPDELRE